MSVLGSAALLVTLGLCVYALIAGGAAAHLWRRRLAQSAHNALTLSFVTTAVASAVLLSALLRNDFSFTYVARTTSAALPTGYTISAFWGGQEGSLLLWLLLLTGFAALAVRTGRSWARDLVPRVVPVFAAVATFFALLLVAVASPFGTQPSPPDGAGMTPSLQNPYMLAHPPLLYLGYVGLTVPFAFAIGALLSGRLDERWLIATRRWTLFAWAALGIGQLLGAHWAYVEVGWGGYYAWDPVENASSDIRLFLAKIQFENGDLENAAINTDIAIENSTDLVEALLLRGEISLMIGDPKDAQSKAQSILDLDPGHLEALQLYARSLNALDLPEEALEIMAKVIPQVEKPLPLELERAQWFCETEPSTESVIELRNLIQRYPQEPLFKAYLAEILDRQH